MFTNRNRLCRGGELYNRVNNRGDFLEQDGKGDFVRISKHHQLCVTKG